MHLKRRVIVAHIGLLGRPVQLRFDVQRLFFEKFEETFFELGVGIYSFFFFEFGFLQAYLDDLSARLYWWNAGYVHTLENPSPCS